MAHLSLHQRQQIEAGIAQGKSNAQIAGEIGVHRATVGREIKRNALSRSKYEAEEAQQLAKTTQRMAFHLRNFEGYGHLFIFSQKRKEGSVASDADFFQLNTYLKSKTFALVTEFSRASRDRNRYTVDERFPSFSLFSALTTFSFHLSTFGSNFNFCWNTSFVALPAERHDSHSISPSQSNSNLFSESNRSTTYNSHIFFNSQGLSSLVSKKHFVSVEKAFSLPAIREEKIKSASAQQERNVKTISSFGKLPLKKRKAAPKRKIFTGMLCDFSSAEIYSFTFSKNNF